MKTIQIIVTCRRIASYPSKIMRWSAVSWTTTRNMCKFVVMERLLIWQIIIQSPSTEDNHRAKLIWIFSKQRAVVSFSAWKCTPPRITRAFHSIWPLLTWALPSFRESHESTPFHGPKWENSRSSGKSFSSSSIRRDMWVDSRNLWAPIMLNPNHLVWRLFAGLL